MTYLRSYPHRAIQRQLKTRVGRRDRATQPPLTWPVREGALAKVDPVRVDPAQIKKKITQVPASGRLAL